MAFFGPRSRQSFLVLNLLCSQVLSQTRRCSSSEGLISHRVFLVPVSLHSPPIFFPSLNIVLAKYFPRPPAPTLDVRLNAPVAAVDHSDPSRVVVTIGPIPLPFNLPPTKGCRFAVLTLELIKDQHKAICFLAFHLTTDIDQNAPYCTRRPNRPRIFSQT